jgi:hypothetical protein
MTARPDDAKVRLGAVVFVEKDGSATAAELEQQLTAAGGRVVQLLEHLLIGWFDSASDCVQYGVKLVPSDCRAGLSAGDVSIEHELLHGLPVIEASRLKELADPGQVLCTTRLARLAGLPAQACTDLGELTLKGIEHPVPVVALR